MAARSATKARQKDSYRYYLTHLGQRLLVAARKLFEHLIVPNLQPLPA